MLKLCRTKMTPLSTFSNFIHSSASCWQNLHTLTLLTVFRNNGICCKNISIMQAILLMLQIPYKSQNYAGIIRQTPGVCSWRWPDVVAGISARFSKFTFVLFCFVLLYYKSQSQHWDPVNCYSRDYNFSWAQYCLPLNTSDGITHEQTMISRQLNEQVSCQAFCQWKGKTNASHDKSMYSSLQIYFLQNAAKSGFKTNLSIRSFLARG